MPRVEFEFQIWDLNKQIAEAVPFAFVLRVLDWSMQGMGTAKHTGRRVDVVFCKYFS